MKKDIFIKFRNILRKKMVIIGICTILSASALALLTRIQEKSISKPQVDIVKAKVNIKEGDKIKPEMYEIVKENYDKNINYITENDLKDSSIAKEVIYKGETIIKERLRDKNENENVEKLLYSLKVDPHSAVAGTIRSGDMILISGTVGENGNAISDYVLKDQQGNPKEIKVKAAYREDNTIVTESDSGVASVFILELENRKDVTILDKSANQNNQSLRLIMPQK
ncbi:hypothetical protein [Clostridium hydrogeniformans]|uniref:hypothetical protein n=1 Tax=Clostridium hydrogeniformans TaxID=349933 RepID=UPI0004899944|nr:hypothetical protein [Clostridium hydrogeniformans]